jgi:hypothetical protein
MADHVIDVIMVRIALSLSVVSLYPCLCVVRSACWCLVSAQAKAKYGVGTEFGVRSNLIHFFLCTVEPLITDYPVNEHLQ